MVTTVWVLDNPPSPNHNMEAVFIDVREKAEAAEMVVLAADFGPEVVVNPAVETFSSQRGIIGSGIMLDDAMAEAIQAGDWDFE